MQSPEIFPSTISIGSVSTEKVSDVLANSATSENTINHYGRFDASTSSATTGSTTEKVSETHPPAGLKLQIQ